MSDDITHTILAKSDQLNAEDLLGGPITIRITRVDVLNSSRDEQPVVVHYENDNGRPWKPCKTMRRVLAKVWSKHSSKWVGRRLTLYNEPTVKWAGQEVGGIRISHMDGITSEQKLALSEAKGRRKPTIIKPLADSAPTQGAPTADQAQEDRPAQIAAQLIDRCQAGEIITADEKAQQQLTWMQSNRPELHEKVLAAINAAQPAHDEPTDDIPSDDFPDDYEGA